jgi:hypothetical protein
VVPCLLGNHCPLACRSGMVTFFAPQVLVFRTPPAVHLYNVVEYGRRFYRTLAFTSDTGWCLQDVRPGNARSTHMRLAS